MSLGAPTVFVQKPLGFGQPKRFLNWAVLALC